MNTRILNREGRLPDDGWYNIEAPGEHVNHEAKVIQVLDTKALSSIINRFSAEAVADANFAGMRIDKDHLSASMDNATESYGWTMQLRNREGAGLEAKIDWTTLGLPLVKSEPGVPSAYKFFSTEYEPTECEKIGTRIVNKKTYALLRPLRLAGLSLTNDPNNRGQRPISNRSGHKADADTATEPNDKTMNAALKTVLGIKADASDEDVVAEAQKIINRATTAESRVAALTTERDTLLTAQVENDLERFASVIKNRDAVKAQLISNRAGTIAVLESLEVKKEPAGRMTNRAGATPPKGVAATGAQDDAAVARRIHNRAQEIHGAGPKRTFASCWDQAQREVADASSTQA